MRTFKVILVTLTLFSSLVYGADTKPKNTLEENILNLLTKWRDGDKGPFSFPLPSLDEIKIPAVSGIYEGYRAKINYATSELKLLGLKNFSVEELDASESNLKATGMVTVPILIVTADNYDVKGTALWFIPIRGSGKMSVTFRKSQLNFSVRLKSNSTSTWVDTLQLRFKLDSIQANLDGGPTAISAILNNYGVEILQGNHDDIVKAVHGQMLPVMNGFLNGMTPDQLFQTIAVTNIAVPNVVQV